MATPSDNYIIAIGASAGGLEEIQHFFDHTPLDSVSYIIVQHLSPDFKSRMAELLAKHSKLKIIEAEENMMVETNQVYLIPSKKFMTISKGRLHLKDKAKVGGPHLTINAFLNSLAKEKGRKAIAVILSGLGSDGTEGAKAIHENGGIIIAREPATTEFSSMPSKVIATGIVDYILEPELMPAAIEYYVKKDGALLPQALSNQKEDKVITAIIDLIKDRLPLDFSDYKQTTILRRIKRRASSHNYPKLQSYLAFCRTNKEEVEALAKDFMISVTSFFRDKEAFDFLQTNIIPEIIKQHISPGEIKIWVAGCATGQEAYSLAMLLQENLTGKYKDYPVKIFATDIDSAALAYAGKGKYPESLVIKDVSPKRIENFFTKEGGSYIIKPVIRKMLIFAQHDLVKNPPYCNMDLISCRNLLIYMTPVLQKKVYRMLHFGLKKGGYLFLGSSENAQPIASGVELLHKKGKIYRNVLEKKNIFSDAFSMPEFAVSTKASKSIVENYAPVTTKLADSLSNEIMKELGYMLICVDDNNQIIKTFGDTTRFLLQKNFNTNLAELLPANLSVAYKIAAHKALRSNTKIAADGIKIIKNKKQILINLLVKPLPVTQSQKLLMVLISEDTTRALKNNSAKLPDETLILDEYTKNIEEELGELKFELRVSNDKLDASNENLQSYNEEILSANEEMQSTNEEMQSVNEELHTINADYQSKNKELMELNDELNNYFRSNPNGQLYVNNDLLLMKFSPGTIKHINLRDTDIGRPLGNISTNFKFETIESDIKEIIKNGGKFIREMEATDGKWYQVITMPYIHQADNKTYGAIITFNDVTELKSIQLKLDKSNKNLLKINEDLDNFVHTASHDLLGPLSNIKLSISIMKQMEVSDARLKTIIRGMDSSLKKFISLVQDMAVIGKIETGMLEMEDIDIGGMINDIKTSIKDKIDNSKALIKTNLKVKQLYFSKKNLRSIIYNLINNAIKFKSDKLSPEILITTRREENDEILLTVKDNGIGIPADGIRTIFDMHGRLHQEIEGQGMGLFLIKKIIDSAGGSVKVESKPGKGSTFILCFKAENGESKISPINNEYAGSAALS